MAKNRQKNLINNRKLLQKGNAEFKRKMYVFQVFFRFFCIFIIISLKMSNGGGDHPSRKGVVMIKNFPHGFYEKQMFSYFSQFGEVTRLKIARSRKVLYKKNCLYQNVSTTLFYIFF